MSAFSVSKNMIAQGKCCSLTSVPSTEGSLVEKHIYNTDLFGKMLQEANDVLNSAAGTNLFKTLCGLLFVFSLACWAS